VRGQSFSPDLIFAEIHFPFRQKIVGLAIIVQLKSQVSRMRFCHRFFLLYYVDIYLFIWDLRSRRYRWL